MIICDKPMYKAFKNHISGRNMPQFSANLLDNNKIDLQQSKIFHRRTQSTVHCLFQPDTDGPRVS